MKIRIGQTYGTRKILQLIATRGKIEHYRVLCTQCHYIRIMSLPSLKRNRECHRCRMMKLEGKFNLTFKRKRHASSLSMSNVRK